METKHPGGCPYCSMHSTHLSDFCSVPMAHPIVTTNISAEVNVNRTRLCNVSCRNLWKLSSKELCINQQEEQFTLWTVWVLWGFVFFGSKFCTRRKSSLGLSNVGRDDHSSGSRCSLLFAGRTIQSPSTVPWNSSRNTCNGNGSLWRQTQIVTPLLFPSLAEFNEFVVGPGGGGMLRPDPLIPDGFSPDRFFATK